MSVPEAKPLSVKPAWAVTLEPVSMAPSRRLLVPLSLAAQAVPGDVTE